MKKLKLFGLAAALFAVPVVLIGGMFIAPKIIVWLWVGVALIGVAYLAYTLAKTLLDE